jgi:hypothetical protein
MNKFIGILFFYVTAFNKEAQGNDLPFRIRDHYLNEKSERYLGLNVSESQIELLKIYLKDLPTPISGKPLSQKNIYTLIEAFDKVFHIENIDYELRMYGLEYKMEMETIDECFNQLDEVIEIIGSSNGVSIVIGHWLEKTQFNRQLIQRDMSLIELGV